MPKINLIKRKKKQIQKKKKDDDDTIQYAAGNVAPTNPDPGAIWMNTDEGKFYVYDGSDWNLEEVEEIDFNDFPDPIGDYDRAMGIVR